MFLEALLYRRYEAKLRYELGFWSRFADDGGTPAGYEEFLTAATGIRYRSDGYLSDMDAGFYSADYLRAWIRSAQLRRHLIDTVGEDWWRADRDRASCCASSSARARSRRAKRSRRASASTRSTPRRCSPRSLGSSARLRAPRPIRLVA